MILNDIVPLLMYSYLTASNQGTFNKPFHRQINWVYRQKYNRIFDSGLTLFPNYYYLPINCNIMIYTSLYIILMWAKKVINLQIAKSIFFHADGSLCRGTTRLIICLIQYFFPSSKESTYHGQSYREFALILPLPMGL